MRRPFASESGAAGAERPARRWPWFILASCILAVGLLTALDAARLRWPAARIESFSPALARVAVAPFGERIAAADIVLRSGEHIPATVNAGIVQPRAVLAAGSAVRIEVTVRRAGWIGWLVGSTERIERTVITPSAAVKSRILHPPGNSQLEVTFDKPVAAVSMQFADGTSKLVHVVPRSRTVALGLEVSGAEAAGTVLVAGTPRLWERLPSAVRVNWFQAAPTPEVLVRPAPKTTLTPTTPLVLRFSEPVAKVLGSRLPTMWPKAPGAWHEPNATTLVFDPSGLGYPLGMHVHIGLTRSLQVVAGDDPATERTIAWPVPAGSATRLEQILAQLDYLPLTWTASDARNLLGAGAQADAAHDAPAGTFAWRHAVPATLRALWGSASGRATVLQGALMAFETVHDLPLVDAPGPPTPAVWEALLEASLRNQVSPYGYSYVYVNENLPETLSLWHNGKVVLTTPVNTGIPGRETALGTYPVYLHLTTSDMRGTNPDGTPYNDPDVPWVNYFSGGDAVHGFYRYGYGYPQSMGCVEAPVSTAEEIFPYVQVGTLVTVVT